MDSVFCAASVSRFYPAFLAVGNHPYSHPGLIGRFFQDDDFRFVVNPTDLGKACSGPFSHHQSDRLNHLGVIGSFGNLRFRGGFRFGD